MRRLFEKASTIAQVASVEPLSTTIISLKSLRLSRHALMLCASLRVIITTDTGIPPFVGASGIFVGLSIRSSL
jgi:hypothetical protein